MGRNTAKAQKSGRQIYASEFTVSLRWDLTWNWEEGAKEADLDAPMAIQKAGEGIHELDAFDLWGFDGSFDDGISVPEEGVHTDPHGVVRLDGRAGDIGAVALVPESGL